MRRLLEAFVVAFVAGYAVLSDRLVPGAPGLVAILALFFATDRNEAKPVPEFVDRNVPRDRAERLYDIDVRADAIG